MEMRCARLSMHRTNLFGYVEFHTAPKDDASATDDAGKEKALEPLGSKAFFNPSGTGRSDRIRTCDPQTPSLMRYQAALRSVNFTAVLAAWLRKGTGL